MTLLFNEYLSCCFSFAVQKHGKAMAGWGHWQGNGRIGAVAMRLHSRGMDMHVLIVSS